MSNEEQDPYHFNPSNYYNNHQNLCFEPSSYNMTFTEFLHGSISMDYNTFDKSCSSSGVVSPVDHGSPRGKVTMLERNNNNLISSVHNSSVSSSSTEAAIEEDSGKSKRSAQDHAKPGQDHEAHESKKVNKSEKKEKREKQPRFAFLTKSEIDNLEDGYKWRKYGQKAVKNSSYPRSYYRCTTQKCGMKKRVERSYEDPTVVITTYEGQHNHQCPVTLRGSTTTNAGAFLPPSFSSSFLQGFLSQLQYHPSRSGGGATSFHHHQPDHHQVQLQVPDYGTLQDLVIPPFSQHKHQEP